MAKPNYAFEKRQRELNKKRKKDEKVQRRAAAPRPSDTPADAPAADADKPPPT